MSDYQGGPPYPAPPSKAARNFLLFMALLVGALVVVVAVAAGALPWPALLVLGALYGAAILWIRTHPPRAC